MVKKRDFSDVSLAAPKGRAKHEPLFSRDSMRTIEIRRPNPKALNDLAAEKKRESGE